MASATVTLPTVLVVEDEQAARNNLVNLLQHSGYTPVPVANGREAFDYLHSQKRPDVILLDMLMPGIDGWQFLRMLQDWSKPLGVPIIITTGTILTREWALTHGCVGFVKKPIDADRLLTEIHEVLRA
jgi:CheY-like chemotaxis protein